MPLESATYINQLDETNPASDDDVSQGDDHLRMIKAAIKASFPGITGAMTVTEAVLNAAPGRLDAIEANYVKTNVAQTMLVAHTFQAGLTLVNDQQITGFTTTPAGKALLKMSSADKVEVGDATVPLDLNSSVDATVNDSKIITAANYATEVQPGIETAVLGKVYPVGSIYVNAASAVNPNTLMGFGTWAAIGQGRVLIGAGNTTDSRGENRAFVNGETGGAFQHVLTEAEMPSHVHAQTGQTFVPGTGIEAGNEYTNSAENTDSAGSDSPHNNVQPYLTVYMWQRTA